MKPKTIKALYWIFTILFVLAMIMDAIGGLMRAEDGVVVMKHLGYPIYAMTIFGIAKLTGALAIVQNKFRTIKEWAYAGFTFNFLGAALSRYFAGDGFGDILMPLVVMAFMFVSYGLWKKVENLPAGSLPRTPAAA